MGKEAALWDVVKEHVGPFGDLVRVENRVSKGMPDVMYCLTGRKARGLIELKDIERWPARATTPVKIEHFTRDQHVWHERHMRAGGIVFVLLRVFRPRPRYYLYHPSTVWEMLQTGAAYPQWESATLLRGDLPPGFPTRALLRVLLEAEQRPA